MLADVLQGYRTFSVDDVLSPYVYVFDAAFLVSFAFTPVMRLVANHYGIIDQPDRIRKLHNEPVAYLGGLAVFLGWMAGLAISQYMGMHHGGEALANAQQHPIVYLSIILGASLIVVMGLVDDVRGIQPWMKIGAQAVAGAMLLYDGIGRNLTELIMYPFAIRLHNWFNVPMPGAGFIHVTSAVLVILVVVGCCNATNLMDGLDGLCGGVTAVIAAGFLFLAVHLAMFATGLDLNYDALRIVLALALLGAVLGFVPYNFNPASIFMGDAGSNFLGFTCATMIILAAQGQHPRWFLAAMVMFALPVLDTALALARRWVNRRPIFSADRYHFHHQLVARGYTVKQAVLISYGLAAFFALAGTAIVFVRTRYAVAAYLVIFGSIIVTAYKMGMVHEKPRIITAQPLGGTDAMAASKPIEPGQVVEITDSRGVWEPGNSGGGHGPGSRPD